MFHAEHVVRGKSPSVGHNTFKSGQFERIITKIVFPPRFCYDPNRPGGGGAVLGGGGIRSRCRDLLTRNLGRIVKNNDVRTSSIVLYVCKHMPSFCFQYAFVLETENEGMCLQTYSTIELVRTPVFLQHEYRTWGGIIIE